MILHDAAAPDLENMTLTHLGFMVLPARIARTGVQEYLAVELGDMFPDREWDDIIRVYRPADEVFKPESMATFERLPVTRNHPYEDVRASNWSDVAVGDTEGQPSRDGDHLRHTLVIRDANAITDVQGGVRELSCGWSGIFTEQQGVTDDGQAYDVIVSDIVGNHVAIVEAGRCETCAVGDRAKSPAMRQQIKDQCKCGGAHPTPAKDEFEMAKFTINGVEVEVADASVTHFQTLQGIADAAVKAKDDAEKALADANAAHAEAIGAKDAEIEDLKGKVLDEAAIDARTAARVDLIADAQPFLPQGFEVKGVADADIRKKAVEAKHGAEFVKDRDEASIKGAFDFMVADAKASGATPASGQASVTTTLVIDNTPGNAGNQPRGTAHSAYEQRMRDRSHGKKTA
ncbi:MAG: DUF2213 domain-containing protein [Pseudomonadota bacterium]